MTDRLGGKLSFGRKLLLAAVGIAAVAGPLVFDLVDVPQIRAQKTQTNDVRLPSFEVASIKVNKSRTPLPGAHLYGDRFNATVTAHGLIGMAYGHEYSSLSSDQISGGPDWIKSELFDIDAKVEDSLVEGEWKTFPFEKKWGQVLLMARSLLADRFKLNVSHETKDLPVFALVLAKNGPKFAEDNAHPEIGAMSFGGPGKLSATSAPFSIFANVLSRMPELEGRLVLDKTGLRGNYTFRLQWTPENLAARGGESADKAPSPDPSGLSLFTALQEQLGLKLESTKAPVDTIVIDQIEQPSTN